MIRFIDTAQWSDPDRRKRFSKAYTLAVPAWRRPVVTVQEDPDPDGISRDEIESLFSDVLTGSKLKRPLSSRDARILRQDNRLRDALTVGVKRA